MTEKFRVAIIGCGTMGRGIAQIAAQHGHQVTVYDIEQNALASAEQALEKILARLEEKGRITAADRERALAAITWSSNLSEISDARLLIEAIVENTEIKRKIFRDAEELVSDDCIIASNTSSLSIASLASVLKRPERFVGIHFFNPAPLMPLVEIVPGISSAESTTKLARKIIDSWGKVTVEAKDTPGFIVNRIARPFYGESIRILEEGVADVATIDWALKELGGFKMGPFELMDLIGNDINYAVTETVFKEFFYDPRYRPSFTQKRLVEAGMLGRKSGRGYYDYTENASKVEPTQDLELGKTILNRVLVMLINEAVDALFLNIATAKDIELAMTKGVNYPKGLLAWAEEIGLNQVLAELNALYEEYGEDRYRPSPLLKRAVVAGKESFLQR